MGTEPLGARGHARQIMWLFAAGHSKVLEVGPAGQQHGMAWEQLEMQILSPPDLPTQDL